MTTPKERLLSLAKQLREAARQGEPLALAAVELVQLYHADTKERLVDASGEDMLRVQGAARQLKKMHTELTRTPPTLTAE